MNSNNEVKYTSFFTRLLVFLIDIFVVSFLVYIINMVVSIEKSPIVILLIWWLYTAIMLSRWKTTIGGKVLGTRILNIDFSKLSFLKASIRFFASIAPFILYSYLRGLQHMMTLPPSPTVQMLPQLIFILLPFIMYISKKRQMIQDMLVKSIVIDVNSKTKETDTMGERIVPIGQKILRIIGTILFLIVFGYVAMYTFVFYTLGKHSSNNYNASFHTEYATNDFNDSRIIFYTEELQKYSEAFVNADGMYDIFVADTKKDLALNCIQSSLKEHNKTDWIEQGSNFRKSARNKYATTKEKIKKAKKNSSYMGRHFYDYDLNDVNEIENNIVSIWDSSKNEDTCDKLVPVTKLFDMFIVRYVSNREEALKNYTKEYEKAKPTGTLNKSFYKREIEKTKKWLDLLYRNTPKYFALLKKLENKRQKNFWKSIEKGKVDNFNETIGLNLNIKNNFGETPLIMVVKSNKLRFMRFFSKTIVNVHMKDNQGKSAFDYAKGNIKMMEALKELEAQQIVGEKAAVLYAYYLNNMDKVTIYINGGECQEFRFPDDMICRHVREYKSR